MSREELAKKSMANSHGIIALEGKDFREILRGPREAGIIAFLTANSIEVGCQVCVEFDPEFETLAQSWVREHQDGVSKDNEDKSLFFARANIKSPQEIPPIFNALKIAQVPRVLYFPPGGNLEEYIGLDIPLNGGRDRIIQVIEIIKRATDIHDFTLYEPFDYTSAFITTLTAIITIYLFQKHSAVAIGFITSKFIWGLSGVTFIILMLGGHMFNQMRGTQIAGSSSSGEIEYFLGEFQNQFAIETQILSVIYGVLGALIVCLVTITPKLTKYYKDSARGDFIVAAVAIIGALLVYMFFAGLTNVFAIKSPRYPFQLVKVTSLFH